MFEFIDGARNADLSPGSLDLPHVLDALSRLEGPGGALPAVAVNVELLQKTAAALLGENLPGSWWGMYAEAAAGLSPASLMGDRLLHYDLHSGNLLTVDEKIYVIDWSFACRGRAWIDSALLVPRLIEAGHSPAQAGSARSGTSRLEGGPGGRGHGPRCALDDVPRMQGHTRAGGRTWLPRQSGAGGPSLDHLPNGLTIDRSHAICGRPALRRSTAGGRDRLR
ncbi:phosphotransferase [Actinomadura madurae]|uniref:phosphotransferase n=1 Tax=Actinomadura madurae TaxID=1993 RepID=UPI0020D25278|nr:phosphotransferase [Actinomadura madurae]MCQ0019310.1 phosphotransferase [Actinomadura madurae]